eukprot:5080438-Prymnesium_polylepis.1
MSPTEVCGSFCGCLSISALAADCAAMEQSQSPPHDLLKPLGGLRGGVDPGRWVLTQCGC